MHALFLNTLLMHTYVEYCPTAHPQHNLYLRKKAKLKAQFKR